jgi:putative ABC transport system ATP-binding protein
MTSDPIIQVRGLQKVYQTGDVPVRALRGIDLDVARGEFLAVIGPSGSGKSTLFHILGGLAAPTEGEVIIDGENIQHLSDSQRTELRQHKVGFVFQKYNLLPTLTALDNILIARYLARQNGPLSDDFKRLLDLLGIANRLDHKPRALSGGEQQRVAIARALVNHPAIVLADEPTGNLDTENSTIVLDLLRAINHDHGQTSLMITHNPEAAAFADRTVAIRDGRIAVDSPA